MNRLLSSVLLDVRLQYRNAFYLVTAGGALSIAMAALYLIPESRMPLALPNLVFLSMAMPFYFVAGLILFEKSENTLDALSVSPLRVREYIFAKVITLAQIAFFETFLVTSILWGWPEHIVPYVLGVIQIATTFTLLGIIVVVRFESVNDFLIPSIPVILVMQIMLLNEFGLMEGWVMLWPGYSGWMLLMAGMNDWRWSDMLIYAISAAVWLIILWVMAERSFERWVIRGGVRS